MACGAQAWGAGSPLITPGLGWGAPHSARREKELAWGSDWAGVRLVGANARAPSPQAVLGSGHRTEMDVGPGDPVGKTGGTQASADSPFLLHTSFPLCFPILCLSFSISSLVSYPLISSVRTLGPEPPCELKGACPQTEALTCLLPECPPSLSFFSLYLPRSLEIQEP